MYCVCNLAMTAQQYERSKFILMAILLHKYTKWWMMLVLQEGPEFPKRKFKIKKIILMFSVISLFYKISKNSVRNVITGVMKMMKL